MSSSRLLVLALLALQPWSGAARHLRGRLLKPFSKSADDPRDEDIAFFYAEEANHDAEEAIFQELYGTSTTTVPPPGW